MISNYQPEKSDSWSCSFEAFVGLIRREHNHLTKKEVEYLRERFAKNAGERVYREVLERGLLSL
jgi:hypothetical protein